MSAAGKWLRRQGGKHALGVFRQPPGHGAAQILAIIVAALQEPHVFVPTEGALQRIP